MNLIKLTETYLHLFNLTQLKEKHKDIQNYSTYSTKKYLRIRYSTQRLDTKIKDWILNFKDIILDSMKHRTTQDTQLKVLNLKYSTPET